MSSVNFIWKDMRMNFLEWVHPMSPGQELDPGMDYDNYKVSSRRGCAYVLRNGTPWLTTWSAMSIGTLLPTTPAFKEITLCLMTTQSKYSIMCYSISIFNLHCNILQSQNYWFSFPFFNTWFGIIYPQGKYITELRNWRQA